MRIPETSACAVCFESFEATQADVGGWGFTVCPDCVREEGSSVDEIDSRLRFEYVMAKGD